MEAEFQRNEIYRFYEKDFLIQKMTEEKDKNGLTYIDSTFIGDQYGNLFSSDYLSALIQEDIVDEEVSGDQPKEVIKNLLDKGDNFISFALKECLYLEFFYFDDYNNIIPYDENNFLHSEIKILFNQREHIIPKIRLIRLDAIEEIDKRFKKDNKDEILFYQITLRNIDDGISCIDIREFDYVASKPNNQIYLKEDDEKSKLLVGLINNATLSFKIDLETYDRSKHFSGDLNEAK